MDILIYLIILIIGGIIGSRRLLRPSVMNRLDFLQSAALLLLLFIMGVNIGLNPEIIASFGTIGLQALVLAAFSIVFSVLAVKLVAPGVLGRKGGSR